MNKKIVANIYSSDDLNSFIRRVVYIMSADNSKVYFFAKISKLKEPRVKIDVEKVKKDEPIRIIEPLEAPTPVAFNKL